MSGAAETGSRPLSNKACFTRLTSPIHLKAPGYSFSNSCIPGRIDSGCDKSGKVIASVKWTPIEAFVLASRGGPLKSLHR